MSAVENFQKHFESVRRLMNFDRDLVDFALHIVRELATRLRRAGFENPMLNADQAVAALEQVRRNDSLRPRYETIFNQSLVLLVSYFASTVHELFVDALNTTVLTDDDSALFREEVKLTIRELRECSSEFPLRVAEVLLKTKDISFQDMQSISRAFSTYVGVSLERSAVTNDIILAQGCRHAIVHANASADEKLVRQLEKAVPRGIKQTVTLGMKIQFTTDEVEQVGNSMSRYISDLSQAIAAKIR